MQKIIQDRTKCIGCMACVGLKPDYFAVGDDGLATLLEAQKEGDVYTREVPEMDDNQMLAGACCGGAISVE